MCQGAVLETRQYLGRRWDFATVQVKRRELSHGVFSLSTLLRWIKGLKCFVYKVSRAGTEPDLYSMRYSMRYSIRLRLVNISSYTTTRRLSR